MRKKRKTKQINKYLGKHLFSSSSSQLNVSPTPLPPLFLQCITLSLSQSLQGCDGQCRRLRLECNGFSLPIHAFGSFSSALIRVFHKPQSLRRVPALAWSLSFQGCISKHVPSNEFFHVSPHVSPPFCGCCSFLNLFEQGCHVLCLGSSDWL